MSNRLNPYNLAFILLGTVLAAMIVYWLQQDVAFSASYENLTKDLPARLAKLGLAAVLIERTVETYLDASGMQSNRVTDPETNTIYIPEDVQAMATLLAVAISIPVAILGLRVLDVFLADGTLTCVPHHLPAGSDAAPPTSCKDSTLFLFWLTDIALTIGLLAAGSDVIHKIIELIPTLASRVNNVLAGRGTSAAGTPTRIIVSEEEFEIIRAQLTKTTTQTP